MLIAKRLASAVKCLGCNDLEWIGGREGLRLTERLQYMHARDVAG